MMREIRVLSLLAMIQEIGRPTSPVTALRPNSCHSGGVPSFR